MSSAFSIGFLFGPILGGVLATHPLHVGAFHLGGFQMLVDINGHNSESEQRLVVGGGPTGSPMPVTIASLHPSDSLLSGSAWLAMQWLDILALVVLPLWLFQHLWEKWVVRRASTARHVDTLG